MRRYLAGVLACFSMLAADAAAYTLHVSPSGSGFRCTAAEPCSLSEGVTGAAAGDTVLLAPGTYGSQAAPVPRLHDPASIEVRGAVIGPGRPLVWGGLALDVAGSTVRDVEWRSASVHPLLLNTGTSGNRVIGRYVGTAGTPGCLIGSSVVLTNALCTRPDGAGEALFFAGDNGSFRHVTATGGATGFHKNFGSGNVIKASIADGATTDIASGGGLAAIDTAYQNAGPTPPAPNEGQIAAPPAFRGAGDHRQAPTSPTIDAGDLVDGEIGPNDLDLNGNLRKLGAHTDVGAYEHVPSAPELTGPSPNNITATSADLTGGLSNFGGRTDVFIFYGPVGQNSMTDTSAVAASRNTVQFTRSLTGLSPNTEYEYAVLAATDGGTDSAHGARFRTLPLPPTASADPATAIVATTATANGSVDLKGVTGTVRFRVTPEGGAPFLTAAQANVSSGAVSAPLTGLDPGRNYTYRVIAETTGGTVESADATFRTLPSAPSAVAGDATNLTSTSATLSGSADLRQATSGTARFIVEGVPTTDQNVASSGALTEHLTGLAPATTYTYRLRITTTGGTVESTEKQFTTLPEAPTVTAADATDVTARTATLSGVVDLEQATRGTMRVVLNGDLRPEQEVSASGPVSIQLTGLTPNTVYEFKLLVATSGGSSESALRTFRTLPLGPAVQARPATAVALRTATLNATVDTQGEPGTVQFVLDGIAQKAHPSTGGAVSLDVAGLKPNTVHTYVARVATAGGTAVSEPVTFRTAKGFFTKLRVAKSYVQKAISIKRRTIQAVLRCNIDCSVRVTGAVLAGERVIGRLKAPGRPVAVAAGTRRRAALTVPRALQAKVLAAADEQPAPTILITGRFTAVDGAANERTGTMGVRRPR